MGGAWRRWRVEPSIASFAPQRAADHRGRVSRPAKGRRARRRACRPRPPGAADRCRSRRTASPAAPARPVARASSWGPGGRGPRSRRPPARPGRAPRRCPRPPGWAATIAAEMGGHGGIALGRPEFRRPAGPHVDHGEAARPGPIAAAWPRRPWRSAVALGDLEADRRGVDSQRLQQGQVALTACRSEASTNSVLSQGLNSRPHWPPKPMRRLAPESQAATAALVSPWASRTRSKRAAASGGATAKRAAADFSHPRGSTISSSNASCPWSNSAARSPRPSSTALGKPLPQAQATACRGSRRRSR